jgi:hypothetical protein
LGNVVNHNAVIGFALQQDGLIAPTNILVDRNSANANPTNYLANSQNPATITWGLNAGR